MSITSRPATAIIIIVLAAFLTATLALACSSATRRAGDVNTDRAALAALYNATNGSSWQDDTNWLSNRPLGEWYGVSTDADGRVAELDLVDNELSGPIPSQLGNLANLYAWLSLSYNQLRVIPLGNLATWDRWTSTNQLSGSIPSELGNLDNLERLSLRNNHLSESIPPELGNLANLKFLRLSGNQSSGSIPSELGNLANLERLWLHNNQLSGSIPPELGNLANLESLGLSGNQLSGCVPAALLAVPNSDLHNLGLPSC